MPRNCVNNPDNFCYICGEVTFSTRKRPLTPMVKNAYECYFGCKVGDQDKKWAPHVCCISCATTLREWLNNKGRSMPFTLPMIWREPTDHLTDCYFCIVPPRSHGITKKKKRGLSVILILRLLFDQYPTLKTSLFQYQHSSIF